MLCSRCRVINDRFSNLKVSHRRLRQQQQQHLRQWRQFNALRYFSAAPSPLQDNPQSDTPAMDGVSLGDTRLDKRNRIVRVSSSGTNWQSVVGLEVHTQIRTASKLFSDAPNEFNRPANSKVSLFDASIPGTLPVLNKKAVTAAIQTALALGAKVNLVSYFDRKHYFYADLPVGYQITQQRKPIAEGGRLEFSVHNPVFKKTYSKHSDLVQIQIEQDSGKSLHDVNEGSSLIDLNRCGTGLLELVLRPDLQDGHEAAAAAKELAILLQALGVSGAQMERGELRVDANISVRKVGEPLGVRTEVKNLNSFRSVARAVEFEVWRQISVLEAGGTIVNETRGFDVNTRQTISMRDKERKQDYRFLPEPNLPPLVVEPSLVAQLGDQLPELPFQTRQRIKDEYDLTDELAYHLVNNSSQMKLFQSCIKLGAEKTDCRGIANLIFYTIQTYLIEHEKEEVSLNPADLVSLVRLRRENIINFTALSDAVLLLLGGDKRPLDEILKAEGLTLIHDEEYIESFVDECIQNNLELVHKYIKAKDKRKPRYFTALLNIVNQDERTRKVNMEVFTQLLKQKIDKVLTNKANS